MSGVKGMYHKKTGSKTVRKRIWGSMRILKRFTLPDLVRTAPGATYGNARKFVASLVAHGIVVKSGTYVGGRVGEYQPYRLVRNTGVSHPSTCDRCGQPLSVKICSVSQQKEKGKETNNKKEIITTEARHDAA